MDGESALYLVCHIGGKSYRRFSVEFSSGSLMVILAGSSGFETVIILALTVGILWVFWQILKLFWLLCVWGYKNPSMGMVMLAIILLLVLASLLSPH